MGLFSFLFKDDPSKNQGPPALKVDVHSHFLPGIDDGAVDVAESLLLLKAFEERGYEKIITTPHIIQDLYQNTPETIFPVLEVIRKALKESRSKLQIDAAAEYYIDDRFIEWVDADAPLLTLKDKFILVETGFLNEPVYLREVLFKLRLKGYKPILAHPERYLYLQTKPEKLEELFDSGVYLQLNTMSLGGYYGKPAQDFAKMMIEKEYVHFLGSDCHRNRHLEPLQAAYKSKLYAKLRELPLLNDSLL